MRRGRRAFRLLRFCLILGSGLGGLFFLVDAFFQPGTFLFFPLLFYLSLRNREELRPH
jgi:hypothetical protein